MNLPPNFDPPDRQEPPDLEEGDMSKTRYLQHLGHSWYLRVRVPPDLQAMVRNTHIRRALRTRDLDEANRRKWPALAYVRAYLDALGNGGTPCLGSLPSGPAQPLNSLRLPQVASQDLRANSGLDALSEEWAKTSRLKTVQFQRQQAYKELRTYLGIIAAPNASQVRWRRPTWIPA